MLSKRLILFILGVICGVNSQFDLGEPCETKDSRTGVCKYEDNCKEAIELKALEKHPSICSYEGNTVIACCPEDHTTGAISRFFEGTKGIIVNDNLTCNYDGYLPMMCCPMPKIAAQASEPAGCPALTPVKTPATLVKPGYIAAWEQCVANERYVNECEETDQGYKRTYDCRVPTSSLRIANGVAAAPYEFAHMAVLGCNNNINTENEILWVGGGSLISPKFILTAAHVLVSSYGKVRYAFLGSLDKTKIKEGELFGLIRLIPYKEYESSGKNHDIALVELNVPVTFSKFIRPACLPLPGIDPKNEIRIVAGWGETEYKRTSSNVLRKAYINVVNGDECKAALSWKGFVWDDTKMICARGMQMINRKYTDSCQGDSGGPLMYVVDNENFNCNYVVDGLVSWGGQCASGEPSSYTRVSHYLDFIVDTAWPELAEPSD